VMMMRCKREWIQELKQMCRYGGKSCCNGKKFTMGA